MYQLQKKFYSMVIGLVMMRVVGIMQPLAGQEAPGQEVPGQSVPGQTVPGQLQTPAQQAIQLAKRELKDNPKRVSFWSDLAGADIRRAREADDSHYLSDAEEAVRQGMAIAPSDFQMQKTQVALMLARHQYAEAKEKAAALNKHTPDDVMTYGYLAEAEIALGDLDGAEKNTQWMLNLRANNLPGLMLAARLRALFHDPDGALDLLQMAYQETSPTEVEELAWIANQMAAIEIDAGRKEAARATLKQAEEVFPNYPYSAKNLSRLDSKKVDREETAARGEVTRHEVSDEAMKLDIAKGEVPKTAPPAAAEKATPTFAPVAASLLVPKPTDTDRQIKHAQALVSRDPKSATNYALLGAAHFQRARETGDVSDYQQAEDSLNKSLELESGDFAADEPLGTMAEVCMGEHRFTDALTYSQKALSLGSGDVSSFAIVGDAYADMGEYEKAAKAYARLTPRDMTLSPRAAYARDSRLAYLKFIGGDTEGAISLMGIAVAEGNEAQLPSENLAWLNYELGEFYVQAGDTVLADRAYLTALTVHPGDFRALAGLGKLRANSGRYDEAIVLYQRAIAVVPMPIFISELGDLYAKTGKEAEARKQYQLVEYIGLLGHINQVLHNRDLAVFYADHDMKLGEALELAEKELEVRHDVYTWDAVAWALFKNGKYEQAREASDKAMRFGTKDALLLFHAGLIAEKAGKKEDARADLNEALKINPHFHLLYSEEARKHVGLLNTQAVNGAGDAR